MADKCINCGGDLFPGAKFCRFCGRQTGRLLSEDLPTRIMPDAGTRESRTHTSPIQTPAVTYAPDRFPAAPAQRRSPVAWVITLIAIAVFGAMFLGFLFVAKSLRREPPRAPAHVLDASREVVLGEEGAEVPGRETVITRNFKIDPDGVLLVKNVRGDIRVEGWDDANVEVRIVKGGGGEADRRATRVIASVSGGNLAFHTATARGPGVEVVFEMKVPRGLHQLKIESAQSDLRVADFAGSIVATIADGSIELEDLSGSAQTEITNGETKVAFKSVTPGERLVFKSVNGNIEVAFEAPVDLDVDAETTLGRITADEELGLDLGNRNFVGQRARGKMGAGGQPLEIKTVHGNIRLVR